MAADVTPADRRRPPISPSPSVSKSFAARSRTDRGAVQLVIVEPETGTRPKRFRARAHSSRALPKGDDDEECDKSEHHQGSTGHTSSGPSGSKTGDGEQHRNPQR